MAPEIQQTLELVGHLTQEFTTAKAEHAKSLNQEREISAQLRQAIEALMTASGPEVRAFIGEAAFAPDGTYLSESGWHWCGNSGTGTDSVKSGSQERRVRKAFVDAFIVALRKAIYALQSETVL